MSKAAAAAPAPAAEGAAPKKKGKKLLFIIIGAVVLSLGGVGGFIMMKRSSAHAGQAPKPVKKEPPVFAALEPFTVNLADRDREHYLQIGLTYEVAGGDVGEEVKVQMPLIRSKILLLLTSKTATELATTQGKAKLGAELVTLARMALENSAAQHAQNPERGINNVHFSAFIIQ